MPKADLDFARYLPVSVEKQAWGIVVRGAGRITNAPGDAYPPAGHPSDHAFAWTHGRMLGAWQVVVIVKGAGECEFEREGGINRVASGDVLLVVPGQWHRYRPSAEAGWVEHWVEFEGVVPQLLTEAGVLPGRGGVLAVAQREALSDVVAAMLRGIREKDASMSQAELAALALRMLGLLTAREGERTTPLVKAVERATHILAERLTEPPGMPALAREVGAGYAMFRREFRRRTGLSPRRYLLFLRLERAQRLIGGSPLTLEAIAEQVGFSSAYHLSAAFKQRFGVPPSVWRKGGAAS
ncbi:MAG: AraC family transcriptional regulator [Opitutaceae bacterium]